MGHRDGPQEIFQSFLLHTEPAGSDHELSKQINALDSGAAEPSHLNHFHQGTNINCSPSHIHSSALILTNQKNKPKTIKTKLQNNKKCLHQCVQTNAYKPGPKYS